MIPDLYKEFLPEWTVIFIQNRECFTDAPHRNPYSFIPFQSAQFVLDNKNYFPDILKTIGTDIDAKTKAPKKYLENGLFLNQVYKSLGYDIRGSCLLNKKNFHAHHMLSLSLTPDHIAHNHLHLKRQMNTKLHINLGYPSHDNLVLVIYNIFSRFLTIDGFRNVSVK